MKYLLDTHTLLWFLKGDKKLSDRARQLIDSPRNAKFLSIASLWEIAIKENGGQGREKSFSVKSTTAAIPRPI
jgi:PIN domain nuclease of toxin-antitoxin system